jgi:hypothetical protein
MANAAGFIQESIWRDEHWRQLTRSAQALYMQLLSQKELDCAGILPLQPNKWAKGCVELTVEQVWDSLRELQSERFVFFDVDTDEVFIRSYMRNSNVLKVPNMRKSARRAALLVGSDVLKPSVAAELRTVGELSKDDECVAVADQINPSETPPEPFPNGSKSTLSEPLPEPTGVGVGKGMGLSTRSNHLGERRPQCFDHETNYEGGFCRPCMIRRKWDEAHTEAQQADELAERRQLRTVADGCPTCQGTNWIPNTEPAERCYHQAVSNA